MSNKLFRNALTKLPQPLSRQLLIAQQKAPDALGYFDAFTVSYWCDELGISLLEFAKILLPLATSFSVAPVSNFHVGAVAIDTEGNCYLGANFEFVDTHIGQTIHAEQSAIAHAWSRGAITLKLLVINYSPCGHCRQFINEVNLADDFCILLPNSQPQPLSYYLPEAFGPSDLGMSERILGKQKQPNNNNNNDNELLTMAKWACENSHAPYSHSYSGIALQYPNHETVIGRYAENAAFNPSLPPLQMALNYRRLQGKDWKTIEKAILVEKTQCLSQKDNTEHLLNSISDVSLQYEKITG